MPRRIAVFVASRANYARLKSVLRAIRDHPGLELQLVAAASALLDRFGCVDLIEREFEIDERLYCVVEGDRPQTMAQTTGLFTGQAAQTLARLEPDMVLVHADRYEMLSVAIAASYMNIPLAHTEGGDVTGSIDDKVRAAISMLADLHLPVTASAAERLRRMGCLPVHVVGSPALDLLADLPSVDFNAVYGGVGAQIDYRKPYIVVLYHPVTTEYDEMFAQAEALIDAVREIRAKTVWLWPNVDAGTDAISEAIRRWRERENPAYVRFFKNMAPEHFGALLKGAKCLVGNTSAGIKEGAFLGTPYVCVGSRQQGREHGENVIFCDHDGIVSSALKQLRHGPYKPDHRFGDGQAGQRIAEVLYANFGRDSGAGRVERDSTQEPVPAGR